MEFDLQQLLFHVQFGFLDAVIEPVDGGTYEEDQRLDDHQDPEQPVGKRHSNHQEKRHHHYREDPNHLSDAAAIKLQVHLTASQDRAPDAVLANILDPNKYVAPNYVQYVVLDAAGRTHTGLIASQTATSITLTREKGETDTVLRADVDELVSTGKSLMPEGLEKVITPADMSDLIAYVTSIQPTGPQTEEDRRKARDFGTDPGLIEPTNERSSD